VHGPSCNVSVSNEIIKGFELVSNLDEETHSSWQRSAHRTVEHVVSTLISVENKSSDSRVTKTIVLGENQLAQQSDNCLWPYVLILEEDLKCRLFLLIKGDVFDQTQWQSPSGVLALRKVFRELGGMCVTRTQQTIEKIKTEIRSTQSKV